MARGLVALAMAMLLGGAAMADEVVYTLQGRITDTSDNWLPDVRVELKRAGVVTHTDGNGLFTLSFTSDGPLAADQRNVYETLELDKEGHLGRSVPIEDLAYFEKPVVEKMEPNPVGEDNVGFTVRLSVNHSLHGFTRSLDSYTAGDPIPEAEFHRLFERKVSSAGRGRTERVELHAYVPEGVEKVKAAFLISRHGMGTIDHPRLRDFADRHGIALVGLMGAPVQRGFLPIGLLDEHIERLGRMAGLPGLADVPVFTFGHSNGTGFAAIYPSQRPERVIGWISYHSGGSWHLEFPGVERVPGLVMHGQQDRWFGNGQERTVRRLRAERNAAVSLMVEANVGHGPVDTDATWAFIVEFCEAAMRVRLNQDGTLRPVAIEEGWLGQTYDRSKGGQQDLAVAPYANFPGGQSTANWLPDEHFAKIWREYANTDPRQGR